MKQFNDKEKRMLGLVALPQDKNPKQAKKKCEKITFTVNNPIQIEYVIHVLESEFCDDSPSSKSAYLYILHDKDENEDGLIDPHLHVIVWGNARRFVDWANQFSIPNDPDNAIPPHMICFCRNPRSMARYLIHKDSPDKHQYSKDEVFGSNKGLAFFEKALIDFDELDLDSEFQDFQKLRYGKILPKDFLKKYKSQYSHERFSSRIRIYTSVYENFNLFPED